MSVLQAILLGIVQGITEFLPVSSFGHLAAIENAMGITRNTAVLFEVLLHIGTMVAVFFAFHEDLRRIGEELLGMIMDIIGNVNIYFHNRKTGENLHYARAVSYTHLRLLRFVLLTLKRFALVIIKKRQWKKQTDALAVRKQNVWKDARYLSISQASFMK